MTSSVIRYSESNTKSSLLTMSLSVRVKRFPLNPRGTKGVISRKAHPRHAGAGTAGAAGDGKVQDAPRGGAGALSQGLPFPAPSSVSGRPQMLPPATGAESDTSVTRAAPTQVAHCWEGLAGGRQLWLLKWQRGGQLPMPPGPGWAATGPEKAPSHFTRLTGPAARGHSPEVAVYVSSGTRTCPGHGIFSTAIQAVASANGPKHGYRDGPQRQHADHEVNEPVSARRVPRRELACPWPQLGLGAEIPHPATATRSREEKQSRPTEALQPAAMKAFCPKLPSLPAESDPGSGETGRTLHATAALFRSTLQPP